MKKNLAIRSDTCILIIMKLHITTDKNCHKTYYASRKEAIQDINENPHLFPKAIGCHYSTVEIGTKKADIVFVLNNVMMHYSKYASLSGKGWLQ